MADLTLFTIIISFLPALVVTLFYTLLFGERRNQFIEAFIAIMYINTIGFVLLNILLNQIVVVQGFNPNVGTSDFLLVLVTDFLFQVGNNLQTFFFWILVSFVAVLFGQLVLMVKLALQDPLKMRFSNLILKIVGKEPESDGYTGFHDRLDHITFEGVEPQPLNPEVVQRAWRSSWRDYLIIGLATLVPSIGFYLNPGFNGYSYAIFVFATWLYRFGYPASNRIAKGAGIKLGDRDIGDEMMRGVLGWFFRLNLLLSVVLIGYDFVTNLVGGTITVLVYQYSIGLAVAAVPIAYAIVMLPLVEDFSKGFYKKVFESITKARAGLRSTNWTGMLKTIGASGIASLLVIGGFLATVFGVCLNYAANELGSISLLYPGQVDDDAYYKAVYGMSNPEMLRPIIWTIMMLIIPMAMMLLLGILGYYIKGLVTEKNEGFAVFSGFVVSTAIWFLLPNMDYVLGFYATPVQYGGVFFYRLRPFMEIPTADLFWVRLISQFLINVPLYISVVLFITYYFHYKKTWEVATGVDSQPLVHVTRSDIWDTIVLFMAGILGSILGVVVLSAFLAPFDLYSVMQSLVFEIGNPNGLELVLSASVGDFIIIAEHNIVRTFLMLVAGPLLWMVVLWFVAVKQKSPGDRRLGLSALLFILATGVASVIWTYADMAAGVFIPALDANSPSWPWTFAAQLGLRGGILYGILFGVYALLYLVNRYARSSEGAWWLPPIAVFFALEYFVYDDQFTIIAVVILPMILAALYKIGWAKTDEEKREDFLLVYLRFGLMSLSIAEVLSTALWVAGLGTALALLGYDAIAYVIYLLPHAIVEIPAFLFAAAASIRIARDLGTYVRNEDWEGYTANTRSLLTDRKVWRTYVFIIFFLLVAALIEVYISGYVAQYILSVLR
jgi:hypothetical protein